MLGSERTKSKALLSLQPDIINILMLHRQSRLPARVPQLIFPPVYSTEMIVAHMWYVYTGTDTYELVAHSWRFEAVNASSRENGKGKFKKYHRLEKCLGRWEPLPSNHEDWNWYFHTHPASPGKSRDRRMAGALITSSLAKKSWSPCSRRAAEEDI